MLEIRQLKYLDAVYRYRSFTQASKELFVTQSAISIGIKNLEEELGVKLLIRSSKNIIFTPEGEELILYAQRILRECQNAENRMVDLSNTKKQVLRLGFSPTLGVSIQAFLLSAEFRNRFPTASIYLDEGFMRYQVDKVKQDVLDLTYNALPMLGEDCTNLKLIPITEEEIFAVMLPSHHLAQYDRIPIAKLDQENIALLDDGSLVRRLLMEQVSQAGVTPYIRSSHNQVFCMLNIIKLGNYVGFLNASNPHMAQYLTDSGLIIRPLEPSIKFKVGFTLKENRHLPEIAKELIENVKSRGLT